MQRFRPWHGIVLVVVFFAAFVLADRQLDGGSRYERVGPDDDGQVRIGVADLEPGDIRFYRFLNYGNQEVKFFVGRDRHGTIQVAFDANEICFKRKRGYEADGDWLICRVCEKAFRLAEVNDGGGGCSPIPIEHRMEGEELVLAEADVLEGWRLFR